MNKKEAEKILQESREFREEFEKTHKKQQEQRERLDRFCMTDHLVDVFENWDEYEKEGSINPATIYELAAKYLREYHESLGSIDEYVDKGENE